MPEIDHDAAIRMAQGLLVSFEARKMQVNGMDHAEFTAKLRYVASLAEQAKGLEKERAEAIMVLRDLCNVEKGNLTPEEFMRKRGKIK